MLTDLTRPQTDKAICEYALKFNPDDSRPKYSLARLLAYEGKWDEIVDDLKEVCDQHPDFVEAWAYYGRALVELDRGAELQTWAAAKPSKIELESCYWLALGIWSQKRGEMESAAVAFWHAAKLNENDGEALNQLAGALAEIGRLDASQQVSTQAGQVTAMRDDVEALFFWRNHSQRAAAEIAKSMQKLGRLWEAATWARIAVTMTQDPDTGARQVFADVRERMTGKTPWQLPAFMVTRTIDLSDLSTPHWIEADEMGRSELATSTGDHLHFRDEAVARGLNHVCEIDKTDGREEGLWIYQSGAGGAAVIDFDLDGWPDFYLTVCDGTPRQRNSDPNRLHRNRNGKFVDVTTDAGVGDSGFSQGLAVGDFNSDGFADIYVGNFGENRLIRNNGDGTFTDVTAAAGLDGLQWTTSVVVADLNDDAIADLYDVNYVAGDDVISQRCLLDDGLDHRSCGPLAFPAERDRVWRGVGDGTFVDMTSDWLTDQTPGRGLGIVVGKLDDRPGMDAYVANDMTANQFWSSSGSPASGEAKETFHFTEQAAIRGLAFNAKSLSQASMGIAAEDFDRDGDVDFYVSHFTDDYNTLYKQVSPGIWSDRTEAADMVVPTHSLLGYGTQWIDADNDGKLELVVANGNVDDFSHTGHSFRMPMVMFQSQNDGRFTTVDASSLGPYFERKVLGRALVHVDANQDQQVDLLVTNLFDPAALLINRTTTDESQPADVMTLHLVATQSHRDAIGTRVTVESSEQTTTRQLLAGDGYQCSNERCLRFGLGDSASPQKSPLIGPAEPSKCWKILHE